MKNQIQNFNSKHLLYQKNDTLLLAVSGGVDSMVLLNFFVKESVNIMVAHCNFMLRGEESAADALFVEKLAEKHNVLFLTKSFDTANYAKEKKLSIQEAARDLRYDWLEEIRKENQAKFIVTAHHLDDNTETLWYNLTKGTGLTGLRGILPKNGKLIRPFLALTKEEILNYAKENDIAYREDSSNKSTKYSRNKLRHDLMPILQTINPNLDKTMQAHFDRFLEINDLFNTSISIFEKQLFEYRKGDIFIAIRKLLKYDGHATLMYELVKKYGFNKEQVVNILAAVDQPETKIVYAENYRLIKDRKHFILAKNDETTHIFDINLKTRKVVLPKGQMLKAHLKPMKKLTRMSKHENYAYLDADKMDFPLLVRQWGKGDYFYPFGMYSESGKAKKKKVSQFFKNQKFSQIEKENTWLVCSGEKIVAIAGYRIDDRYKVTDQTKNVLQLELIQTKNKS